MLWIDGVVPLSPCCPGKPGLPGKPFLPAAPGSPRGPCLPGGPGGPAGPGLLLRYMPLGIWFSNVLTRVICAAAGGGGGKRKHQNKPKQRVADLLYHDRREAGPSLALSRRRAVSKWKNWTTYRLLAARKLVWQWIASCSEERSRPGFREEGFQLKIREGF